MYTTISSGCVNIIQITVQCGSRAHDTDIIIIMIVCTWSFCAYHYYRGHTAVMHSAGFRAVSWTAAARRRRRRLLQWRTVVQRRRRVTRTCCTFYSYFPGTNEGNSAVAIPYILYREPAAARCANTHIYIYG